MISQRLIERLQRDFQVPTGARFRRLYPGRWQRSAGAWVWIVEWAGGDVGSICTATECLQASQLIWSGGEITPYESVGTGKIKREKGE